MKVSVIIVSYNVCKFLEQTLVSVIKASACVATEIIVVDNHSADGSVEMVKSRFPEVTLIANRHNVGFSKANNQGIRIAKGEYLLLLNPDTVIEEDTLLKCSSFMDERPDGGALGVKMVDGSGKFLPESKRSLPTPWIAFYKIFGLSFLFPKSKRFGRYHLSYMDENDNHEVEVLAGAFMMLRGETLNKTGLLDEDFFMYGEDIDLSYRILKAGYKNYYYSGTRIIHYKGESTKKTSVNYVFVFYNAMIIFYRKHFSHKNAGIFTFLISLAIYTRATVAVCSRFFHKILLPITDFAVLYAGMILIKNYWEAFSDHSWVHYPAVFSEVVLPLQILVWMASVQYCGGYHKPYKIERILTGALVGMVIISSISNFLDPYRFSRMLIVMGCAWVTIGMLAIRLLIHYLRYGNFRVGEGREKRLLIIGNAEESERVVAIIQQSNVKANILGFLSTDQKSIASPHYLGNVRNLAKVTDLYNVNEIIFCAKNLSANAIIETMTDIQHKGLEYKIVPDGSNFIIGSNSKNTQGDFYSIQVNLSIIEKGNIRNKRLLDISLSIFFIISYPLVFWMMQSPLRFLNNIWKVLLGDYSWVGFATRGEVTLPRIKKGILNPLALSKEKHPDKVTIQNMDLLYARDYSVLSDLFIILRSLRKLDMQLA